MSKMKNIKIIAILTVLFVFINMNSGCTDNDDKKYTQEDFIGKWLLTTANDIPRPETVKSYWTYYINGTIKANTVTPSYDRSLWSTYVIDELNQTITTQVKKYEIEPQKFTYTFSDNENTLHFVQIPEDIYDFTTTFEKIK